MVKVRGGRIQQPNWLVLRLNLALVCSEESVLSATKTGRFYGPILSILKDD